MATSDMLIQPFVFVALAIKVSADYRNGNTTYENARENLQSLARNCPIQESGGVCSILMEIEEDASTLATDRAYDDTAIGALEA